MSENENIRRTFDIYEHFPHIVIKDGGIETIEVNEIKGQILSYKREEHLIKIEQYYDEDLIHWTLTFEDTVSGEKVYIKDKNYKEMLRKEKFTEESNELLKQEIYQVQQRNKTPRKIYKLIKSI